MTDSTHAARALLGRFAPSRVRLPQSRGRKLRLQSELWHGIWIIERFSLGRFSARHRIADATCCVSGAGRQRVAAGRSGAPACGHGRVDVEAPRTNASAKRAPRTRHQHQQSPAHRARDRAPVPRYRRSPRSTPRSSALDRRTDDRGSHRLRRLRVLPSPAVRRL